jgi:hypothetical protein
MFHRARAGFCGPIVLEFLGFDFDPITHHAAVERIGDPRFRQIPVCRYSLAAISVSRFCFDMGRNSLRRIILSCLVRRGATVQFGGCHCQHDHIRGDAGSEHSFDHVCERGFLCHLPAPPGACRTALVELKGALLLEHPRPDGGDAIEDLLAKKEVRRRFPERAISLGGSTAHTSLTAVFLF